MTYTLPHLLWMFYFYAFLGWCTEVLFHAVRHGKFVNRGFLNGPVCPIYGFGVVSIIVLLTPLQDHFLLLFLGAVVLTSTLEYITGWSLEKIFHARWWDYRQNKFNLQGYICLEFSLLWGLAATLIMRVIHPVVYALIQHIPSILSMIFLSLFTLSIIADLIATVASIHGLQKKLRLLDTMSKNIHGFSDTLGDSIFETYSNAKEKTDDLLGPYAALRQLSEQHRQEEKALLEEHQKQERALFDSIYAAEQQRKDAQKLPSDPKEKEASPLSRLLIHGKSHSRILRAFPDLSQQAAINTLFFLMTHQVPKKGA